MKLSILFRKGPGTAFAGAFIFRMKPLLKNLFVPHSFHSRFILIE
jgi:hypothetical protein